MNTKQVEAPTPFTEEGAKQILTDGKQSAYNAIANRHNEDLAHSLNFIKLAKDYFNGDKTIPFDRHDLMQVLADAFTAAEEAALKAITEIESATDEKSLEKANKIARKNILLALGGPLGLKSSGRRPRVTTMEVVSLIKSLMKPGPIRYLDNDGELLQHPGSASLLEAQEIAADVTGLSSRAINHHWSKRETNESQQEAVLDALESSLGISTQD